MEMKRRVRVTVLFGVMVLLAAGSVSHATIQSMSATGLTTSFTADDGVLSIWDTADIVVENTLGQQTTYTQGEFDLNTLLQTDASSGGIAIGSFAGGYLSFTDSSDNALLTGDIVSIDIVEPFDGWGMLTGQGQFKVTGGILESDFALPHGDIVQITFNVSPASIGDFSADFTGSSLVTTSWASLSAGETANLSLNIAGLGVVDSAGFIISANRNDT